MKVGVDQQDLPVLLGQRQRQIGRDGGLALILRDAGDEQDAGMVPLRGLNGARGQLLDLLREVEVGGWHGDEQALVGVLELGVERFVLFLVVDGAK